MDQILITIHSHALVQLENFIDGKWQPVPQADRVKLTQLDGQVWLALANVLLEPACRAAYEIDDFRCVQGGAASRCAAVTTLRQTPTKCTKTIHQPRSRMSCCLERIVKVLLCR